MNAAGKGVFMTDTQSSSCDNKPLVMIIDDDRFNLTYLKDLIELMEYEAVAVQQSIDVMFVLKNIKPDVILLDVVMPNIDGYELCKLIKENPDTADIPVLFITSLSETNNIVKGFDVGGLDYVTKPFRADELSARIRTHIDLKRSKLALSEKNVQLEEAYLQIEAKNRELQSMMNWLEEISNRDYLTNLYNRRFMMKVLEKEKARSFRHSGTFALLLCDIDKFKNVNDTFGHDFGDLVLIETARLMNGSIREEDTLARWGGEEFLILLPISSAERAYILAERIRSEIEKFSYKNGDTRTSVTMSIGISESDGHEELDDAIKRADEALYECKRTGRNKILTWSPFFEKA